MRLALWLGLVGCGAPDAPTVRITPEAPTTLDDLTLEGGGDGVVVRWFQDGILRDDLDGATVAASETARGETWAAVVVATSSGGDWSSRPAEAGVRIANSPPVVTLVVSPGAPTADDDLEVAVTVEDADEDPVGLSFQWSRDGERVPVDSDRLGADWTAAGETWTVAVTATDGVDESEPASGEVVVGAAGPPPREDEADTGWAEGGR